MSSSNIQRRITRGFHSPKSWHCQCLILSRSISKMSCTDLEDFVTVTKVQNFPSTDNSFVNYVTIKWSITGSESTYLGPDLPPSIGCKLIIWPLDFLQEQLSILRQEYELWKQPAIIKNCSISDGSHFFYIRIGLGTNGQMTTDS